MTKMAAMPIYGKNPSKISGNSGPISMKLGMKHRWLKHYNVYINHDPVVTLTYIYLNHIQTSSLKPLGQSKPNFM